MNKIQPLALDRNSMSQFLGKHTHTASNSPKDKYNI